MILVEVQCPRCKRLKKYINYNVNKKSGLYLKQTDCYKCGMRFTIVGAECNRIIKLIRQSK